MAYFDTLPQGKISRNLKTNMQKKPTTNKNKTSRTQSYSLTGNNCRTFIWRFSNGPQGLDSHPCPAFTVLPRLCCWQVRYALEQDSVHYNPKANFCSWTFLLCFCFQIRFCWKSCLFVYVLSTRLLQPNGRVEAL